MNNFIDFLKNDILLFDIIFIIIVIYNTLKCLTQGFSLSFLSSLKRVASAIVTIIFVPRLQPWVSEYIESQFINNVGVGVLIFILTFNWSLKMRNMRLHFSARNNPNENSPHHVRRKHMYLLMT